MPSDLTIDLIGGWDLTSGPQDGGPNGLDLTEVGGPLTYGADGVSLNGSTQYLKRASSSIFHLADTNWFAMGELLVSDTTPISHGVLGKGTATDPVFNNEYSGSLTFNDSAEPRMHADADITNVDDSDETTSLGDLYNSSLASSSLFLFYWIDGNRIYSQVNDNPPSSNAFTLTRFNSDADFHVGYDLWDGAFAKGSLRHVRLWSRALASGDITWLYNGGAGRTAADILATGNSGGGPVGVVVSNWSRRSNLRDLYGLNPPLPGARVVEPKRRSRKK